MNLTARKAAALVTAAAAMTMAFAGSAGATGSSISPSSQTVYNARAYWNGSWSGPGPYFVTFYFNKIGYPNNYVYYQGSGTSKQWSHQFPNTCGSNSYKQEQDVLADDGSVASAYANTTNSGAHGC